MLKHIKNKIRNTLTGIKNLVAWAPLIWKDRDWDYGFLEEILKFKLTRMAKCIIDNDIIEGKYRVEKQIKYALYLMERIDSNYDLKEADKKLEAKWGKTVYSWEPVEGPPKASRLRIRYPKAETEEMRKQASDEHYEAYMEVSAKEAEIYERLYRHIGKYIRGWWD